MYCNVPGGREVDPVVLVPVVVVPTLEDEEEPEICGGLPAKMKMASPVTAQTMSNKPSTCFFFICPSVLLAREI